MKIRVVIAGALLLAGCGKGHDSENAGPNRQAAQAPSAPEGAAASSPSGPPAPPAPTASAQSASAKTVLIEPKGPIDPKSVEAAGQVVQHYGALIEQGRWTASRTYWGDAESAKAFERNFRSYADVHIEIGDLGEPEGAAGSIYVTEPVTFYGKTNAGGSYHRAAQVTLRRVNDVPGSSEAQRRWHIERIEWK